MQLLLGPTSGPPKLALALERTREFCVTSVFGEPAPEASGNEDRWKDAAKERIPGP